MVPFSKEKGKRERKKGAGRRAKQTPAHSKIVELLFPSFHFLELQMCHTLFRAFQNSVSQ